MTTFKEQEQKNWKEVYDAISLNYFKEGQLDVNQLLNFISQKCKKNLEDISIPKSTNSLAVEIQENENQMSHKSLSPLKESTIFIGSISKKPKIQIKTNESFDEEKKKIYDLPIVLKTPSDSKSREQSDDLEMLMNDNLAKEIMKIHKKILDYRHKTQCDVMARLVDQRKLSIESFQRKKEEMEEWIQLQTRRPSKEEIDVNTMMDAIKKVYIILFRLTEISIFFGNLED